MKTSIIFKMIVNFNNIQKFEKYFHTIQKQKKHKKDKKRKIKIRAWKEKRKKICTKCAIGRKYDFPLNPSPVLSVSDFNSLNKNIIHYNN